MNNDEKRLIFNTFARNFDIALASGNTTNMAASIRSIISALPGSDIPQLSIANLKNFSDKMKEIIDNARSNGLDVKDLEELMDFIRTAYHLRSKSFDEFDNQVNENINLDKSIMRSVKGKVDEVKLAMYLSGDNTTGKTIIEVPDSGTPVVQIRLSDADIKRFDKNLVYAAMRADNMKNRSNRLAVEQSAIAVSKTEDIISDLTDIAKLRVDRAALEEQRKQVEDGLTPLEGFDYSKINPKEVAPTRDATETAEYAAINKLMTDDVAEFQRLTNKLNTYEDLMRLSPSELESLLIKFDAFDKRFTTDFGKIDKFIKKHPTDVRAMNLQEDLLHFRKAISITRLAMDDVQTVKESTLGIVRDRRDSAKLLADQQNEHFVLPALQQEMKYKYILGMATDAEIEIYNNSNKDAFKVKLNSQERKDKAAIAAGNDILERQYNGRYKTALKQRRFASRELKRINADYKRAETILAGIKEGKITNYMSYLIHERGSVPIGYNLYNNMDRDKATKYQAMLAQLSAPEEIDEAILHELITEEKKKPKPEDKPEREDKPDKDKKPDGPDEGKDKGKKPDGPDGPGGPGGPGGPDGPDGPSGPGGGSGGGSGEGSGSGEGGSPDGGTPEDPDKDKKPDGPDGGSGEGTDKPEEEADKDKDKDKKRHKPRKLGKLYNAAKIIAIATGVLGTGMVIAYLAVNGIAIATPMFLGLSAVNAVSAGTAIGTRKK